ncbi:uncharacterized protein LOC112450140 isoform X2 [Kryptolebias marmoratus]|uniref:uncharacterized protein LOC112450140 isoform X2 n=1 Tax=Kryptolebias marmoratus TaxID=37003 RepID=UPI0018ACD538|nr:uncharacterized protein LOC112450140 isoform X2 [Kryptolebias marmoratus]
MEVTALLMNLFVLLAARAEHSDTAHSDEAAFPKIVPDKLQFVEFESVSVQCEVVDGMNTWRVTKKLHKVSPETSSETCNTSGPSCTVDPILERHSGEYWCENDEGEATNAVNISVTAGFVILDIPARPVMEGSDLTLWCLSKKTDLDHIKKTDLEDISDFYKDGALLSTTYKSNFTIQSVSKSDEGRYKCSISGKGDSPESRLAVFKPDEGPDDQLHSHSTKIIILRSILVLLLVIIGLIVCRKLKGTVNFLLQDGR